MEQSYVILKDVRKTYHMGEVSINAVDGPTITTNSPFFITKFTPSAALIETSPI